jgi:hypothetical protein
MLLSITILAVWGAAVFYLAFADDWISFFIITSAFLFTLFFVDAILAWLFWIPNIKEIILTIEIVIGSVICVKFCWLLWS